MLPTADRYMVIIMFKYWGKMNGNITRWTTDKDGSTKYTNVVTYKHLLIYMSSYAEIRIKNVRCLF